MEVGLGSVSARCSCFRGGGMVLPGAVTYPSRRGTTGNTDRTYSPDSTRQFTHTNGDRSEQVVEMVIIEV